MNSFPFASLSGRFPALLLVLPAIALAAAGGCTSALTTASLRGLPWDTADKQAEKADEPEAVVAAGAATETEA